MSFDPLALGAHEKAFQNAEGIDFWDPPEGQYQAQCTGIEWKKTKAGDQMLMIKLKVMSGQFASKTWTANTVFKANISENKLGVLKTNLLALGINANQVGLRGLNPDVLAKASGQVVTAKVSHSIHQGKTYVNTKLSGGGVPNVAQEAQQAFGGSPQPQYQSPGHEMAAQMNGGQEPQRSAMPYQQDMSFENPNHSGGDLPPF
jgi:hypothetical protein